MIIKTFDKKIFMPMTLLTCSIMMFGCGQKNNTEISNETAETTSSVIEISTESEGDVLKIPESILSFKMDIIPEDETVVGTDAMVNIANGVGCYRLSVENPEYIEEINFYHAEPEAILGGDGTVITSREYIGTYYDYYPMDNICMKYDYPEKGPDLIISIVLKNGQVFEYYVTEEMKPEKLGIYTKDELTWYEGTDLQER